MSILFSIDKSNNIEIRKKCSKFNIFKINESNKKTSNKNIHSLFIEMFRIESTTS
jgi:hypothetical protein